MRIALDGNILACLAGVDHARDIVHRFRRTFAGADTTDAAMVSAHDLLAVHRLRCWDALILGAAADAGCARLLSKHMQPGFVSRGVKVVNPLTTLVDLPGA